MVQRISMVAFEGIEARAVDVQVQVAPGLPAFNIVGLPDKAVSEAKERVRAALVASGLALPARRITVNLAPADLPKEGGHYDLPIALGLMAAIGAVPQDAISGFTVLDELGLDGGIAPVAGVLPAELLEVSVIASVAGEIEGGALTNRRPFRSPHHSASMPALVGGGLRARPGEISLAHNGVLFLDEMPEFSAQVLDSLRQPLETGDVAIARVNHRITYPARFMLVAAINPCRCGRTNDPGFACKRGPNTRCVAEYQSRLSGPLLDRIDLHIDVPAVTAADLILPPPSEGSREVAARVARARDIQLERYAALGLENVRTNAQAHCSVLEQVARADGSGLALLRDAAELDAPVGARLSPRAARRPHAGRSRRHRKGRPRAFRRSAVLPRAGRRSTPGSLIPLRFRKP